MKIVEIPVIDKAYPAHLKELFDAPPMLYCAGNLELLKEMGVGIVGTRRCSDYGENVAYDMAKRLSEAGLCVVSGLAYGIDTAAHKGAMEGRGKTIAVLAQGLPTIMPRRNKALAARIVAEGGLLLSENDFGREVYKGEYLRRNRLISGLSRGIVVVEAAYRSGALNTAAHALEQNREVMAVPGRARDEKSLGCLRLIKRGAALVCGAEDVADCLGVDLEVAAVELLGLEKAIYELLLAESLTPAELAEKLGGDLRVLYQSLSSLELRGLIRRGNGASYSACS